MITVQLSFDWLENVSCKSSIVLYLIVYYVLQVFSVVDLVMHAVMMPSHDVEHEHVDGHDDHSDGTPDMDTVNGQILLTLMYFCIM